MTIFNFTIRRIMRDKGQLITMLLVPIGFITLVMMLFSGGQFNMSIGVVDYDNTEWTQSFINSLDNKGIIVSIDEDEIEGKLLSNKINLGLVIPKGFTDDVVSMENPQIQAYSINETDVTVPVTIFIDNFLAASKHIAAAADGNIDTFNKGISLYINGSNNVKEAFYDVGESKGSTVSGMGFLVMSMLYFSVSASGIIMEDKEGKTFYRVLTAPVRLREYMLQKILSFLVLLQAQVITVFLLMKYVFKMNMGPSLFNLLVALFVFSIVCISFGVALTSLSKNTRQLSALSPILIIPMVMLGGSFWPREIMPEILIKLSNIVPTTWILISIEKILYGQNLVSITTELGILLMFSIVFFLLGTWKKTEIEV
ncbi:ABC transporter permease [Alkaliphilus pronyensis]|uniref:ABC transporter permease n=1 Tax=Alkaliphilus pronyensis TaxID=1482732 RepID=A0A6I0F9F9_9FIRM|nr:ABC transporter permease [Alkaliphilus pronyensis]KAB3533585.1 ABC transporter permease [Alkaliphilus pronyensis]